MSTKKEKMTDKQQKNQEKHGLIEEEIEHDRKTGASSLLVAAVLISFIFGVLGS